MSRARAGLDSQTIEAIPVVSSSYILVQAGRPKRLQYHNLATFF